MKNIIVVVVMILGMTMVGCDDIQDTGASIDEAPKTEKSVNVKACDVCGSEMNKYELEDVQGALMCKECAQWHKEEMAKQEDENKALTVEEAEKLILDKFAEYGMTELEIFELNDGYNDRTEFMYFDVTKNPLYREAGIHVKIDVYTKEMFIVGDDVKRTMVPIDDVLKDVK